MAISLMCALLDVANPQGLATARPDSPADKFFRLSDVKKRQVRETLYEAFYAILESQKIDYMSSTAGAAGPPESRGIMATRGIGVALARVISSDLSAMSYEEIRNVDTLKSVLQGVVNRAIDDLF